MVPDYLHRILSILYDMADKVHHVRYAHRLELRPYRFALFSSNDGEFEGYTFEVLLRTITWTS
jgi:hypothetical protein